MKLRPVTFLYKPEYDKRRIHAEPWSDSATAYPVEVHLLVFGSLAYHSESSLA